MPAGDYLRFQSENAEKSEPGTGDQFAKSAAGRPFRDCQGRLLLLPDCLAGAAGFVSLDGELEIGRPRLSERSRKSSFREIRKQLETFEFREPYRIGEVQSFGEKWTFGE
jgi:hypothetical protein